MGQPERDAERAGKEAWEPEQASEEPERIAQLTIIQAPLPLTHRASRRPSRSHVLADTSRVSLNDCANAACASGKTHLPF